MVVRSESLSLRTVQAFLSWMQMTCQLSFIFIAQTIENSVFHLSKQDLKILFLRESEGRAISSILTHCLNGGLLKSRKQERIPVQAAVMLKKSSVSAQSPTGAGVQFLREGAMNDFSQGGAQIEIPYGPLALKDFVSLMYKDQSGKWVSVESQVRWTASSPGGQQIIGVQFLAVST